MNRIGSYLRKVNKDKVKQISLVVIACFLFAVGFINYNSKSMENDKFALVENENADLIGDVQLVNSGSIVENENETLKEGVVENSNFESSNAENSNTQKTNNENLESGNNNENSNLKNTDNESVEDYFENIRIDRDAMYSRMLETYNKMIDNEKLAETQKSIAVQEIEKITNNQNAILISENLIKNKGFDDAVVFANSDIINVIVKTSVLTNEDIGKIQNIIEREFGVSLENVNISNKN